MTKEELLSYINNKLLSEDIDVKYDFSKDIFSFYINEINFYLVSTPISISLIIEEKNINQHPRLNEEILLTKEEGLSLLNKCLYKVNNEKKLLKYYNSKIEILGKEVYKDIVFKLKNYLKNANIEKELEDFRKDDYIHNYSHEIIIDNMKCKILLGAICDNNAKKNLLFTSLININFRLENGMKSIYSKLVLPSYKLEEYPVLNLFVINNIYEYDNSDKKINRVIENFSQGKNLLHDVLDFSLNINNKIKKTKI